MLSRQQALSYTAAHKSFFYTDLNTWMESGLRQRQRRSVSIKFTDGADAAGVLTTLWKTAVQKMKQTAHEETGEEVFNN